MTNTTCGRCGTENAASATFCDRCKFPLKFRPAILKDNCWEAAPDELAVFFRVSQLDGLFSKAVVVPAGMRAFIVQDGKAEEVGHGTHPVDSLLSRLSRLFSDKHADILITRQNAAAVEFSFEDIHSAEFLEVGVTASINVRIGDAASFTQHFMAAPGCVTLTDVRGLLASAVRQVLADFIGALSLREMVGKSDLREKLSMRMLGALKERFASYGLLVEGVESLSLRHDKFTQNRQVEGTLWLVADEQKLRLAHQRDLDQLYSEDEWRKIKHEEEDIRLRYRRSELRQDEAEQAQVIRQREIELYERVTEADTRAKAIQHGAADAVAQLEADYLKKHGDREDEAARWKHIQSLAALKKKTEFQLESERTQFLVEREKSQLANNIEKIRIANEIEQARLIEDEEVRREEISRLRNNANLANQRGQELQNAQHRVEVQKIEQNQKFSGLERLIDIQNKRDQAEFDLQNKGLDAVARRKNEELELNAKLERDRIEIISKLPVASLIAISGGDPTAVDALKDLGKLEAFKDMSAEQIRAFAYAQAGGVEEQLANKDKQTREMLDHSNAMMKEMRDFGANAMREMKEVAVGVAQGGHGIGIGLAPFASPIQRLKTCPACGTDNLDGARFCHKCGTGMM